MKQSPNIVVAAGTFDCGGAGSIETTVVEGSVPPCAGGIALAGMVEESAPPPQALSSMDVVIIATN